MLQKLASLRSAWIIFTRILVLNLICVTIKLSVSNISWYHPCFVILSIYKLPFYKHYSSFCFPLFKQSFYPTGLQNEKKNSYFPQVCFLRVFFIFLMSFEIKFLCLFMNFRFYFIGRAGFLKILFSNLEILNDEWNPIILSGCF